MNEATLLKQIVYLEEIVVKLEQDKQDYRDAFFKVLNILTSEKTKNIKVDEEKFQNMLDLAYEIAPDDKINKVGGNNMEYKEYSYEELKEIGEEISDFYVPGAKYDDSGMVVNYPINYIPFTEEETEEFHVSNCSKIIKCKLCGNTKFSVGVGVYNTVIRCDNCGWERSIHSG